MGAPGLTRLQAHIQLAYSGTSTLPCSWLACSADAKRAVTSCRMRLEAHTDVHFTRIPFGLETAPTVVQRYMNDAFSPRTSAEHERHVKAETHTGEVFSKFSAWLWSVANIWIWRCGFGVGFALASARHHRSFSAAQTNVWGFFYAAKRFHCPTTHPRRSAGSSPIDMNTSTAITQPSLQASVIPFNINA
jgi:hypothetical protein